jgi:hypothetical protein
MSTPDHQQAQNAFKARIFHYGEVLNPLFDPRPHMKVDRFFELVCVLVRSSGIQDAGWDPWHESQAILNDLLTLAAIDLPREKFPDADRTRLRLGLLSYCHVTEMDLPYALMANLLRLRLGMKYDISPFRDLHHVTGKGAKARVVPPSPTKKIERISKLAEDANLPEIASAIKTIYDSAIRNAIYHSDYTLTDQELRLLAGSRFSPKQGVYTPVVELEELNKIVLEAFAFYRALFGLYQRCLSSFGDFKEKLLPYDFHYKGILELLFDAEASLSGFRVYWPNEGLSEYSRSRSGCAGSNLTFDADGSINFFVGLYASKPGSFSPLVEDGASPSYPTVPGTKARPHWPEDLKSYKLNTAADAANG